MSSVASTSNPGMTYLTQLLSGSSSPLLSGGMSSSQVQSVLQNSSTADLVQLSDQALQLQNLSALFGTGDTSQTETSSSEILDNILATMSSASSTASASTTADASGTSAETATDSSTSSLASQIASYQGQLQEETTQALLGTNSTEGTSGGTLSVFA